MAYPNLNTGMAAAAKPAAQKPFDPMYRSTHTPEDAARDAAGMQQFNDWTANQRAQGLQTNGGVGGITENWSAGGTGQEFSGVGGGNAPLEGPGVKKPLSTNPYETNPGGPAAPNAMAQPRPYDAPEASMNQQYNPSMGPVGEYDAPTALPPATNTTMPVGGNNVISSNLNTGMAASQPLPQSSTPQAAPPAQNTAQPDTMSQDDPWAWHAWAQQRDPETYKWQEGAPVSDNYGNYQSMLEQAGLWQPGYISESQANAANANQEGGGYSPVYATGGNPYEGLTMRYARGPGHQKLQQLLDKDGKVVGQQSVESFDSLHEDSYRNMASVLAIAGGGMAAPYVSGAYAGAGLAAGTAGNAIATGATLGALGGQAVSGTTSGTVMGGALGAAGGAAGHYYNNGTAPTGNFEDPAMWQAGDQFSQGMANPGVNIPGNGDSGTAEQIRFLEANGLSAQEIGQVTGGAYGYTGADLAAMGQISANAPFNQTGTNATFGGVQNDPNAGKPPAQNAASGAQTPAPPASTSMQDIGAWLKANPQLAAALISGGLGAIGGGGGNPPAPPTYGNPGTGGTGETGTGTPGTGAGVGSSSLQFNAGDPNQFYQDASDAAYRNQTRYLDPQVAQQQKALEARLSEQGFVPGTPGYNQAMQNFMDTNARAYSQARDTATLQGYQVGSQNFGNSLSNAQLNNNASNSALDQLIRSRMMPINERNAIMTGDQIQYNNQLDQYNAKQETRNSNNQLIGQLATAIGMYFSDARLKDDITPIGRTPGGLGIYSYTIFGRREIGVIAQEVQAKQPHACIEDPESGFLMVDYGRIA